MKGSLFFALTFLISAAAFSQDFLKGPAAKNAKIGKFSTANFRFVFDNNPLSPKGASAKKYNVWNRESSALAIQTRKEINNPKGLKAKNRKVWKKELAQVETKASYIEPKQLRKRKVWWH